MANIYTSMTQLIGNTPILELTHIEKEHGLKARLLAKLEYLNATILGGDTKIGDGCTIGGNVWLTSSVKEGTTVIYQNHE